MMEKYGVDNSLKKLTNEQIEEVNKYSNVLKEHGVSLPKTQSEFMEVMSFLDSIGE